MFVGRVRYVEWLRVVVLEIGEHEVVSTRRRDFGSGFDSGYSVSVDRDLYRLLVIPSLVWCRRDSCLPFKRPSPVEVSVGYEGIRVERECSVFVGKVGVGEFFGI